ncbi:response regulator [Aestuariirhabdus sp. LZHN29]|uniref:response regulator n=1 Tax=Aestuariirhabdus sp. LZHN29 TaxID=3417462 RepID=UPI003CEBABB6
MNFRLGHAVAFTAALVAFASVLFLGAVLYNYFAGQLRVEIQSRNELVARASSGEVAAALRLPAEVLRHVAAQVDRRDPIIYTEAQLDLQVQRNNFFEAILLLDRDGNSIGVGTPPALSTHKAELRNLSMAFQDFYTQVLNQEVTYWSRIISSPITGQPTLTVSYDSGDDILVGYLNLGWLEQIAQRLELGGTVDIRFIDSDGVLFRAPDAQRALQRLNVNNISLISAALGGSEGTGQIDYFGTSLLATVVSVPSTRWVLMVSQRQDEAFAPLKELLRITVMAALIAMLGGALMAFWLSRKGTNSIVKLSEEVRRIALGDYLFRPSGGGFKEAQALRQDVQSMAASISLREKELTDTRDELRRMNEELEERVRARTDELLASQAALRQSEQLQDLLESSPVAVGISRRSDGKILFANRRSAEIFGYTPEEMYERQIANNWVVESQRDALLAVFDAGGTVSDQEVRFKTSSGEFFWGLLTWYHLRMDNQDCILYWIYDISEMKQVESQLSKAREDAEMAVRAKADFLANMSHEIRTPMNAVIGLSHLLETTRLETRQKDYLSKMQSASAHLLNVINDILDYSKLDSGRMQMESIPFSIEDVLGKACDIVRLQAENKGLELLIAHDWEMPLEASGDPLRLGQILINLMTNAVKFTDRGQIVVSVALVQSQADVAEYRFTVADSGIGMTREQIGTVFSSFSQADSSMTRRFGGTGLGLAICTQLVERMGGSISVTSELGKGSEFSFTVQLEHLQADSVDPGITDDSSPSLSQLEPPPRLLLLDDSPVSSAIYRSILSQFGAEVIALRDHTKVSSEVRRAQSGAKPYDLLLVNCQRIESEGIECLRDLCRELDENQLAVVLMVGSKTQTEVLEDRAFDRIRRVLLNPVSPSALFVALSEALESNDFGGAAQAMPLAGFSEALEGLAGARALVVEDTHVNQQVVRELLQINGLVVKVCGNGREALDALHKEPFDIVLMDIQMPVMDGYEATREIRKNTDWDDIPVVAMTAHTLAGDRERCIEVGMNDHIGKPLDPDILYQTLKRWIKPTGCVASTLPLTPTADAGQQRTSLSSSLPDYLPGIDLSQALNRVAGNRELLLRLLSDFYLDYRDTVRDLMAMLSQGDSQQAARLVHTIKGAAGNLGGERVVQCAQRLLQRWGDKAAGEGDSSEDVTALVNALNEMFRGLSVLSSTSKDESGGEQAPMELDAEQALVVMEKLQPLLRQSSSRSNKVLNELRTALAGNFADQFAVLHQQVSNYEYELAAQTLADMMLQVQAWELHNG